MSLAKKRALELGEPLDGNVQGSPEKVYTELSALYHWHRVPVQFVAICGRLWVASSTPAWALTILRDLMPEEQKPKQVRLYKVSNADIGEAKVSRSGEIELQHDQTSKLVGLVWSDQRFTDREKINYKLPQE
jgi:hypothetical protein